MKWEYINKTEQEIKDEYNEYLAIMNLHNRNAKNFNDWMLLNNYIIKNGD